MCLVSSWIPLNSWNLGLWSMVSPQWPHTGPETSSLLYLLDLAPRVGPVGWNVNSLWVHISLWTQCYPCYCPSLHFKAICPFIWNPRGYCALEQWNTRLWVCEHFLLCSGVESVKGSQERRTSIAWRPTADRFSHRSVFGRRTHKTGEDLDIYSFKTKYAHGQKFLYTPQFGDKCAQQNMT